MANHPYNLHREQQVAHRRVGAILKGEPPGAKQHAQGNAFSKVTSKSAAQSHDDTMSGARSPKRFARGGKVKHGGHHTNINIVVPGGGGAKPPLPPGPPMGGPPPMPGGPPPMGMPPGLPPGGPPPGMPMRASGGRVPDRETWGRNTAKERYARGGAATGVGREEKAAKMKRK